MNLLQMAGEIKELEYQVLFTLNEKPKVTIRIDFKYNENGCVLYEDTKGILTRDSRTKLAWLEQAKGIKVKLTK